MMKFNMNSQDVTNITLGVLGLTSIGIVGYNTSMTQQQFAAVTNQQAETSAVLADITKSLNEKTGVNAKHIASLRKRQNALESRLAKLEASERKKTQNEHRRENNERVLKKLGRVPSIVIYKTSYKLKLSDKERYCLRKNVYHEAAFESDAGMLAVAQVTGNRVASKHRGTDFCSVVYAPKQFSWTNEPKTRYAAPNDYNWKRAGDIVASYENGSRIKGLEKSEFYYARYIKSPGWSKRMQYTHYLGEHLFLNHKS